MGDTVLVDWGEGGDEVVDGVEVEEGEGVEVYCGKVYTSAVSRIIVS